MCVYVRPFMFGNYVGECGYLEFVDFTVIPHPVHVLLFVQASIIWFSYLCPVET